MYLCWSFWVGKKLDKFVFLSLLVAIGVYGLDNIHIVKMASSSFHGTLKSLVSYTYEDDIIACIHNLYMYMTIYGANLYHCGIISFCYIGYPVILFGGILWCTSVEFRKFFNWYGAVLLFIIISFFLMAFSQSVYKNIEICVETGGLFIEMFLYHGYQDLAANVLLGFCRLYLFFC